MLQNVLRAFEPFSAMEWSRLSTLCRHARTLTVPASRWLLRPGRTLSGSYYLLEGRLAVDQSAQLITARSRRARRAVYPGASAIRTVTAARMLHVDVDPVAFLLGAEPVEIDMTGVGDHGWQRRFLESPVLQQLSPLTWQRLLRSMLPMEFKGGNTVVSHGDAAEFCYVVTRGFARVSRRGAELAMLKCGDLFGEDALITGAVRNADVRFVSDGAVVRLQGELFLQWVCADGVRSEPADGLAPEERALLAQSEVAGFSGDAGARERVDAEAGERDVVPGRLLVLRRRGRRPGTDVVRLPVTQLRCCQGLLDTSDRHLIGGLDPAYRALAGFVLAQQGFDVRVLV